MSAIGSFGGDETHARRARVWNERQRKVARISVNKDTVIVEGELLDADEERFALALEKLKRSRLPWTTVDLGGVTKATHAPMKRLAHAWFDMFCQHRPPYINAPDIVWKLLGTVTLDTEIARWKADASA